MNLVSRISYIVYRAIRKIFHFPKYQIPNTKYLKRRFLRVGKSALVSYLIVATVLFGTGIAFLLKPWWSGGSDEAQAVWFNDNWSYRQIVPITKGGGALTDTQVMVSLDTATLIAAGKLQPNCADLRFTTFNGTVASHFIDLCSSTANVNSLIWVKVPRIESLNTTTVSTQLYVYYGNASAPSTSQWMGTPTGLNPGSGADGACSVTADTNINTGSCVGRSSGDAIATTVSTLVNASSTTITVASVTGLSVNDEILIINLQGTSSNNSTVGQYEFARITTLSSTTLTLNHPLVNSYDGTTQKIVVQRVPNYTSVTTSNSNTDFTPSAWNGTSGGVMAFRANGTVTVASGTTINANSLGYRGGAGGAAGSFGGINAESYDGAVTTHGSDGATDNASQGGGRAADNPTGAVTGAARSGGGGGGSDGSANTNGSGGAGAGGGHAGGGGGGGGGADSGLSGGSGGTGGSAGTAAGGGGGGCAGTPATGNNGGNAGSAGGQAACTTTNGTGGAAGSGATGGGGGGGVASSGAGGAGGGGGGIFGSTSLLTFGGGGGGGGGSVNSGGAAVAGQAGSAGGGIIMINATTLTVSGGISATGGAATLNGTTAGGGGGGGAGGMIFLNSSSNSVGTNLITATGGAASTGTTRKSGGGAGGDGRIVSNYNGSSGSTNPTWTPAQIPVVGSASTEEKAPSAVGYWKFDEGTGTLARTSTTPGFSPKDMSGLALWLDASSQGSIQTQTGVSQWNDLSGNGRNFTQSTGSRQPAYTLNTLNGKPVVTFTASASQTMTNSTNFSTPNTVIYVSRQTGGTNARVLSGLADNWLMGYHNTRRQQAYFNGWVLGNGTGPLSTTNWYIYSSTQTGALSTFWENGTQLASNANGVAGPNGLSLNGHQAASEFSDAQIAEVLVFNRVISATERQRVEAYLAAKWGQGSTLDTSNPYFNQTAANSSDGIMSNFASPPSATSGWQTEDQCISSKCLRFDGTDDYVDLSDPADLQPTNISVGTWFKTTSTSGMMLIRKRLYGYGLQMGDNADSGVNPGAGKVSFWIVNSTPTYYAATSSQAYNDGKWHYAEGTYDGSNVRLYIDGTLVATTAAGTMHYTADAVAIGRDAGAGNKYYNGTLDEVKIYNYTRSADQIKADYNARGNAEGVSQQQGNNNQNMPAVLSNGLAGYWKLDESSGNATDSSGNGLTLTNNNTTAYAIGKFGNAGSFTAASSMYLSTATTISGVKTVSFWTYNASTTDDYVNLTSGAYITSSSGTVSATGFTSPTIYVNGTINGTLTASTWNHVVITSETGINANAFEVGRANSSYNNGKLDEVRTYNRALSDDDIALLYNWAPGPIGQWNFEEGSGTTANDTSGYANTGTITGAAYVPGKYGKALDFDGSDDYVDVANESNFDFADKTFTVSGWFKADPSAAGYLLGKMDSSNQGAWGISYNTQTSNKITVVIKQSTSANAYLRDTSNNYTDTNWHHFAMVITTSTTSAAANDAQIYIDGKLDNGTETETSTYGANNNNLLIGKRAFGNQFEGLMDNVAIYNYGRNAGQVIEDMNAGHPAPGSPIGSAVGHWKLNEGSGKLTQNSTNTQDTTSGLLGYWNFDETSGSSNSDYSTNNNTLTFGGTNSLGAGKYGNALTNAGGGAGTNVAVSAGSALDLTSTSRPTFSFWLKNSTASQTTRFWETPGAGGWGIEIISGDLRIITFSGTGASFSHTVTTDGAWHHYAIVVDGVNAYLYKDATLTSTVAFAPGWTSGARTMYILGDASFPTVGSVDDARLYSRNLTAAQITALYNAGPEATLTNMAFPATSSSGWTQDGKFSKALIFDGTNDRVYTPDSAALDLTTSISISAWVKADAFPTTGNYGTIVERGYDGSSEPYYLRFRNNGGTALLEFGSFAGVTDHVAAWSGQNLSTGTWYHIAGTWDGSTYRLYVNGIQKASTADTTGPSNNAKGLNIGASDINGTISRFFDGTIDEVKLYSGALTAEQVNLDMNQSSAQVLGTLSSSQTTPAAAASEYCIPGDSSTCTAPVARWDLEEGTGTVANDQSGNANTGTLTNGPTWGVGKIGKAVSFDGADDVISAGSGTSVDNIFAAGGTVEAWIYPTGFGEGSLGRITDKASTNAPVDGYAFLLNNASATETLRFGRSFDGATGAWNSASSSIVLNRWNHVVVTYNDSSASNDPIFYVNGVVSATTETNTPSGTATTDASQTLLIGNSLAGDRAFAGRIDNVRMFNYIRTPAQIAWDYNQGKPQAQWKLDECQGTTANDSSGNGYSGTISIGATGTYTTAGNCATSSASSAWYNGATGKRNYSLAFDGTDDRVSASGLADAFFTTSWTQAFWVKTTQTGITVVTEKGVDNALVQIGNGFIRAGTTGGAGDFYDATVSVNDGNWHHVVVTYNSSTKAANTYMDGVRRGGATLINNAASSSTAYAFGGRVAGGSFFSGQLDDLKVYNYDLTATQVKTLFSEGVARYGPVTGAP